MAAIVVEYDGEASLICDSDIEAAKEIAKKCCKEEGLEHPIHLDLLSDRIAGVEHFIGKIERWMNAVEDHLGMKFPRK